MGRDPSPLGIVFLFIVGVFGATVAFSAALVVARVIFRAVG
jgi:hypothetical protein